MSFDKVGFGIIGTGAVAAAHAMAITNSEFADLKAVYDVVPERAKEFAAKYNAVAVDSFEEFLKVPGLEAVTVATPSGFHHDPVVAAAKAGKHILCEKPLDITLEKIDDMIRQCKENGVLLAAIFSPVSKVLLQRSAKPLTKDASANWFPFPQNSSGSGTAPTTKAPHGGAPGRSTAAAH